MENSELKSENAKYKCPYCDKKIKRLVNLKGHVFKEHLKYRIYCPYCNENYRNLNSLLIHLRLRNDVYHRNLFNFIARRHFRYVDKKLFLEN
jgi:glutaredoxin